MATQIWRDMAKPEGDDQRSLAVGGFLGFHRGLERSTINEMKPTWSLFGINSPDSSENQQKLFFGCSFGFADRNPRSKEITNLVWLFTMSTSFATSTAMLGHYKTPPVVCSSILRAACAVGAKQHDHSGWWKQVQLEISLWKVLTKPAFSCSQSHWGFVILCTHVDSERVPKE